MAKELSDAFKALNETLGNNLLRADRENATVYLQRIPAFADLPIIAPASLVKPISPNLEAARDGLFTSVIPDGRQALLFPALPVLGKRIHSLTGCPQTQALRLGMSNLSGTNGLPCNQSHGSSVTWLTCFRNPSP